MGQDVREIIILGSGPAGLTAAIYNARANLSPLLVHGPLPGGQLTTTTEVENFPGFENGIMGPELMETMEKQAERFGTEIVTDTISQVTFSNGVFTLQGSLGSYSSRALIVATGASPRLLGVPNEKELMGYGVSTCATCDGAFFRNKVISVIGGGDSACEEANFLTRFGSKVYLIHRRDELRASKIMRDRVLANPKIELVWNSALKAINGSKESGVHSITLESTTEKGKETQLEVNAVFIAIGHIPNTHLFKELLRLDENGYVVTEPDSTKTPVPGLFVAGDAQDHVFRQAITAAGSGCMAAMEAERWLESQH